MLHFRPERASHLIREQISWILLREMEIPGVLITVTDVDVQKDLGRAIVHISFLPFEKSEASIIAIRKRAPYFQHLLAEKMNIRPMPFLVFEIDPGPENAARVEKILSEDDTKE